MMLIFMCLVFCLFVLCLCLAIYTLSSGFVFLFFISLRWSWSSGHRKWPTAQGDCSAGKTSSCRSLTTQTSDVVANAHTHACTHAGRWEMETGDCLEVPEPASWSTVHRQESLKLNKEAEVTSERWPRCTHTLAHTWAWYCLSIIPALRGWSEFKVILEHTAN